MLHKLTHLTVSSLMVTLLAGCGAGSGDSAASNEASNAPDSVNQPGNGSESPSNPPSNTRPVAQATLTLSPGTGAVTADGRSSHDADGHTLSYVWSFSGRPQGSSASLTDRHQAMTSFVPDLSGTYTLTLTVSDGSLSHSHSTSIGIALNRAPIANAGENQEVELGALITLNGEASSDPDQNVITYEWSIIDQPAGSNLVLQNDTTVSPTFVPELEGDYTFELIVNDGILESEADTVVVTAVAANIAPHANAGADQSVSAAGNVVLDGSGSFDSNNDTLGYRWRILSKPLNSAASLINPASVTPSISIDREGNYMIELVVTDGQLTSAADTVNISYQAANRLPVANAGPDQQVSTSYVRLNGLGSNDPDGDSLRYQWTLISRPASSSASLNNSSIATPEFYADAEGSYVWQLVVNDDRAGSSQPDAVQVTYLAPNQAPVANAGPDQTVAMPDVELDGSASSDADGDDISYRWSLVSRPSGSSAVLDSTTSATPRFTADLAGQYVWRLTVTDGKLDSQTDSVTITYAPSPQEQPGSLFHDFAGSGALSGFTTNNASALPNVSRDNGRYRAVLTDNSGNRTLHYHAAQGRLDALPTRFPFEFIARNVGIGTVTNSQTPHPYQDWAFNFAGVQVHSANLASANSSHVVVGHRGGDAQFTIEGKNTVNGNSQVNDIGSYRVPNARADIRIVGDANGGLTVYWQTPNANPNAVADNWTPYNGNGKLPGTQPNYGGNGATVYVGLITYAYGDKGIPFVGTCDSVELIEH